MIIKNDFLYNKFLKIQFWYYRNFKSDMLQNISVENKNDRQLTFIDNFDKVSWGLDCNSKWLVGETWGKYHPKKPSVYFSEPELLKQEKLAKFSVKFNPKNFLNIDLKKNFLTIPFQVSWLTTSLSFKQQYGRFECRCTIPYDKGVWPAFWLWADPWPPEIDIFELYGRKTGKKANVQEMCVHYSKEPNTKSIKPHKIKFSNKIDKRVFHEFALEWSSDKMEFFVDGIKVFRFSNKKILDKWFNTENAKMQMVINHSIHEKYITNANTNYYSEFFVDYIRAYK